MHKAILDAAMRLASVDGIHGLSIGKLAAELGVSKSGLYAHFGSKLDLQLETIEAAGALITREVIEPATAGAAPGRTRLERLCEAYLSYVERRVFPGGCFFAALTAEADAQSGPVHDAVVAVIRGWLVLLEQSAREAKDLGEVREDVDVEQLAFELHALLENANYLFILFDDAEQIRRARHAIGRILETSVP